MSRAGLKMQYPYAFQRKWLVTSFSPPRRYDSQTIESSHDDFVRYILLNISLVQRVSAKSRGCFRTYPLQLLIRQAHAILHPHFVSHATILAQNGNALHLDAVLDNARGVTSHRSGSPFDSSPCTNTAVPSDDRIQHTGVVLDLRVLENNGFLDTDTRSDDHARTDGDVGPQFRRRVHLSAAIDKDRRDDVRRRGCKFF